MEKELVKEIDGIKIYQVDGEYVRDHLNLEFTNFGQHYRFPFIPSHEIWLDKEYGRGEREPFIAHALKERELMSQGIEYPKAYDEACKEENKYRDREDGDVRIRKLRDCGDVKVYLVDGKRVRGRYTKDFVQGGHCFVYHFIPRNEIWIDDDIKPEERSAVILHELTERNLMGRRRIGYERAHRKASLKEKIFRKKEPSFKVCH